MPLNNIIRTSYGYDYGNRNKKLRYSSRTAEVEINYLLTIKFKTDNPHDPHGPLERLMKNTL